MRRRIGAGRIRGEGYKGSLWLPEGSKLPGILLTKTGVRKVGGRVWGKVSSVKIEMDTDQDRSPEFRGVGAAEEDG